MSNNASELTAWMGRFKYRMNVQVPKIIAETATEYFKESFVKKSFDGKPWAKTKKPVKKGSLMVRSGALMSTVRPSAIEPAKVTISAGSSKVRYAKIHNEGGPINRSARTESFNRNRIKGGKRKGRFKKGTTSGQGLSFKAYSYNMPQRQFMGHTAELNNRIKKRLQRDLNT